MADQKTPEVKVTVEVKKAPEVVVKAVAKEEPKKGTGLIGEIEEVYKEK
jgi:hypothetical protein